MEYSELINMASLQTLHNQAESEEAKAEFIAHLKNTVFFIRVSTHTLVELLEQYAIAIDGQTQPLKNSTVISTLYAIKNNLQIESNLDDFIQFHLSNRGK